MFSYAFSLDIQILKKIFRTSHKDMASLLYKFFMRFFRYYNSKKFTLATKTRLLPADHKDKFSCGFSYIDPEKDFLTMVTGIWLLPYDSSHLLLWIL